MLHLDNNGLNNYFKNLKWGTHKENTKQCHDENRQNRTAVLRGQAKTVEIIKAKKLKREISRIGKTYGFFKVFSISGYANNKTRDLVLTCICTMCSSKVTRPSRAFRIESIMLCSKCKKKNKHLWKAATIKSNLS